MTIAGFGAVLESSARARLEVLDFLRALIPLRSDAARDLLSTVIEERGWLGAIGTAGLVWASTRLFGSLRSVLTIVFEIPSGERLSWVRGKLHDVRMVLGAGTLFLVTVGLTSAVRAADLPLPDALARVLALGATFAMFYFVYRHVPARRIDRFDAVIGTIFSGVLFEAAKILFVVYLVRFGRTVELYGPLATVAALALWAYYSAVVFLLGAEIAAARAWVARQGPDRPSFDSERSM